MTLPSLAEDAKRLCQQLLRIDTTNPPGNERPAAELLAASCARSASSRSCSRQRAESHEPGRAPSRHRQAPPLLLTAHLDVVEADPTKWQRPPFSGDELDGCLWGRGAIDMKNMAAMCTAILRRLARDAGAARPRRHLRGGRRRGGRLRSRLAVPRRAAPRAGRGRVRDRRVGRVLAAPRRHDVLSGPGRREGLLLGARAASPASPATARCRATTAW